ncbi:MAG: Flp pilus assembly protein CpaB [Acidobacteria bacterium]|nr:Flp pilus assembly protein CpaB [Acidobacteriota bacterium]
MNRSTRTFIVVAIAVGVAALASFGVFRAIQQMPVREVEVRSLHQVVAVRALQMGQMITKDDVKLVAWPASSPVESGFTEVDKVLNRGLIDSVVANEPLTESKLASLEAGAGLSPTITEGMRALSVKVNDVIGVAGYVVPGAHVDVIVTLTNRNSQESMTRVVVSDVEVLTAGTSIDREKAREGAAMPASVVTLLVTPQDAERIALAANEGSIMLTLRNPLDRAQTQTAGIRTAALLGEPSAPVVVKSSGGRRVVVRAPAPVAPPLPKVYTVETFRGAKRGEEVIR